jgi:hypothetical protein
MTKIRLTALYLILMLSLAMCFLYFTKTQFIVIFGMLLLVGVVNIIFPPMAGFAVLITFILGLGFYTVVCSWGAVGNMMGQVQQIVAQVLFSVAATVVWLVFYHINNEKNRVMELEQEVQALRKVEPITGVLTYNEFIDNARLLLSGMKRRQESGFYLIISVKLQDKEKGYRTRVKYEKLMALLLASTRTQYDLIGYLDKDRAIVFLSNTDHQGLQVVLDRFYQKVVDEKKLTADVFQLEINELPEDWESFESQIYLLIRGESA